MRALFFLILQTLENIRFHAKQFEIHIKLRIQIKLRNSNGIKIQIVEISYFRRLMNEIIYQVFQTAKMFNFHKFNGLFVINRLHTRFAKNRKN